MKIYGEYWLVQQHNDGLHYARRGARAGAPMEEGVCADWDSLPAPPGASLILAAPGTQVRTHVVSMPTRSRRRFLAALPFALEERLFHPPETYHLAPLSVMNDSAAVAVVEHARVQGWIDAVGGRDWSLVALLPEYLLMPQPAPDTWLLDLTAAPALLRFPTPGGAALPEIPGATPPGSLLLALEQAQPAPRRLEARVGNDEQHDQVGRWQSALGEFGVELQLTRATVARPAWLARQARPGGSGNLLTGRYAPPDERRLQARQLLPAGALAAVLLALLGAQWLLEYNRISAEHDRLSRAIEATYREAFPEARNLVDPRYQMERRLAAMRPAGEQADILTWLELLAPYMNGDSIRLDALDFDGERLALELSLTDVAALENLQAELAGLARLSVQSSEPRDGRVYSLVRLERLG